jgi:hypothetical protein
VEVVGLLLVRDEADILEVNLRHHLATLIDRAVVVDNGSTDGSLDVLRRLADELPVSWTSDPGPYRQKEITTELAREAGRRGADWVVPIDADEFWCGVRGDPRPELSRTRAGVLRVPLVCMIQRRDVWEPSAEALLGMTMRAASPVPVEEAVLHLDDIAPVLIRPMSKCISRPTSDLVVMHGNHDVTGARGDTVDSTDIHCFHASIRARSFLVQKGAMAVRMDEGGFPAGSSFHTHRWAELAQVDGWLEKEWAANSWEDGAVLVNGERRPVVEDTRFADLVRPWISPTPRRRPGLRALWRRRTKIG